MPTVDLERLFNPRLVVGRLGEMDPAKWWNTKGQLGRLGTAALRRGFLRTHRFAQAHSAFGLAAHRCTEVFELTGCIMHWRLADAIDRPFDARWEHWLDHAGKCPLRGRWNQAPAALSPHRNGKARGE